jgi:hypothetical protein
VGNKPLRLCTLCGHFGGGNAASREETFGPDIWKSDRPTPEQSAKHMVTLQPGESVSLPTMWRGIVGINGALEIRLAYQVGPEFAKKHHTWEGLVEARPVVFAVKKQQN